MKPQILIRADDLGYSRGVNYGIADCVWNGVLRNAGLLPNMPAAPQALELLRGSGVCLGQHTNVCLGRPVTDPSRIPSLVDENGQFKNSHTYREAWKRGEEFAVLEEMVLEVEAQYQLFVTLVGQEPAYFEGHAVASKVLFKALEIVAKKYKLPIIQGLLVRNPLQFRNTKLYLICESSRQDYDPFESLQKAVLEQREDGSIPMFVCHPGYLDQDLLSNSSLTLPRVKEAAMLTDPDTARWLREHAEPFLTYADLC